MGCKGYYNQSYLFNMKVQHDINSFQEFGKEEKVTSCRGEKRNQTHEISYMGGIQLLTELCVCAE